jgi:sugar (pentulose or hexulose) kinase
LVNGFTIVLDVGKTLSKVSLWTPEGVLLEKRSRPNDRVQGRGYLALDVVGIEAWLVESLAQLAKLAPVSAIVPVAHGAAMAIVREGRLHMPPMDYENPMPANERQRYDAQRDTFIRTGSPALPDGLNLGAQLHLLDLLDPYALRPGATLLPLPQYWAWRLSGVAAAEVSSLGCHTDLWCPDEAAPSTLAVQRGWADLLAPLRHAGDCLGTITSEWSQRTGLSPGVKVYCGLHDSNAALLAARGFPEIASGEATVLSTGTWFVSMRTPGAALDVGTLPEHRDCLLNVDVHGQQIPSARFMGGREIESLTGVDTRRIDIRPDQPKILAALGAALEGGARLLPSFVGKCGPYPRARGRWIRMPAEDAPRRAIVSLYAALVADVSLDLIGARDRLLIEGRFAAAEVFVRSLARLRPDTAVFVAHEQNDVSYGALRLIDPRLSPKSLLTRVEPLDSDLHALQQDWRAEAERMELAV